jgi:hypothetical protein
MIKIIDALQAVMPESPSATHPEISFGQHAALK